MTEGTWPGVPLHTTLGSVTEFCLPKAALRWLCRASPVHPQYRSPQARLGCPFGFWGLSLAHGPQAGTAGPTAQDQRGDRTAAGELCGVAEPKEVPLSGSFPSVARCTPSLDSQGKAGLSLRLTRPSIMRSSSWAFSFWLYFYINTQKRRRHNCWPTVEGYMCG